MDTLTFVVGIALGVVLGIVCCSLFRAGMTVEDALAFLKSKGYWVTVNINPKEMKQ